MVELTWNVNQPARWRRVDLLGQLKEQDTDWKRFLMNRPYEPFDPRKYLEFRLFWPYSSGIYMWKDGRRNWDTILAAFDYGPQNDPTSGFQVTFASRMHNGDEHPAEIYYSNGGELNLTTNMVSPKGGLPQKAAAAMNMQANLLPELSLTSALPAAPQANIVGDLLTSNHVRNWMECVRSRKQPNAPVDAGYSHSIATIMTNAAVQTGYKAIFDEKDQEILVNGKVFKG
jgi:hypothetical protein